MKKVLGTFALLSIGATMLPMSVYAAAGTAPRICELEETIINLFNFFIATLPFIAVIVLLYAAWMWMTSSGDPQKLQTARDAFMYGVIGSLIAFSSVAVVMTVETFLIDTEAEGGIFKWSDGAGAMINVRICDDSAATGGGGAPAAAGGGGDLGTACTDGPDCDSGVCGAAGLCVLGSGEPCLFDNFCESGVCCGNVVCDIRNDTCQ